MYKDKDKQKEAARERQRRYRALRKGVTNEGVTAKGVTGVNLELCRYCGAALPALQEPRKHPGACNACSESRGKPQRPADYNPEYTGPGLTAYEQQHYKPANELSAGQFNPVSRPGDSQPLRHAQGRQAAAGLEFTGQEV